jgi:hypothetical protein
MDTFGDVFDDEWIHTISAHITTIVLALLCSLIKDDIAGDNGTFANRVIAPVSLGAALIFDNNCLLAPIIKLLEVQVCILRECHAPECAQEVHDWRVAVPSFVRSPIIDHTCGQAVRDEHGG